MGNHGDDALGLYKKQEPETTVKSGLVHMRASGKPLDGETKKTKAFSREVQRKFLPKSLFFRVVF